MSRRVVRYKPPIGSTASEPFIRFNLPMTGMSVEECAAHMQFSKKQIEDYATNYVPKCSFIALALQAFPHLDFYDLFYVMVESDGTYFTNRLVPLPTTFEEAVGCGLKLEPDPDDDKEHPKNPLRINIYDDNVAVCGFGPDGTFYKYGRAFRNSAVAQYIAARQENNDV